MRVEAIRNGVYGNALRVPGDVFTIQPSEFSAAWMVETIAPETRPPEGRRNPGTPAHVVSTTSLPPAGMPGRLLSASSQGGVLFDTGLEWIGLTDFYDLKGDGHATGNGVADDTAAVQASLDAMKSAGVRRLYAPPGTYILSDEVAIDGHQGLEIYGAGYSTRFLWKGGDEGPMFRFAGTRETTIRGLRFGPFSNAFPLEYGIVQEQDGLPGSGTSTANRYKNMQIEGLGVMGAAIYLKGDVTDANNDGNVFEELFINGYEEAAIILQGANCLNNSIGRGCQFLGGRAANYGIKSLTGAGGHAAHFNVSNCIINGHLEADLYLQSRSGQPVSVDGLWSEGSERLLLTGGPNGSACFVKLAHVKWASDLKAEAYPVIDFKMPGPLMLEQCELGSDYAKAITIALSYTPGFSAPLFTFNSLRVLGTLDTLSAIFPGFDPSVRVAQIVAQTADDASTYLSV